MYLVGMIFGFVSAIFGFYVSNDRILLEHAREVKQQCEQTLPRNQQCEIIAVPKEEKK